MYKIVCCTCEVVVLLIKPIVFLTFSLSSASLDLKVPILSHGERLKKKAELTPKVSVVTRARFLKG